MFKNANPHPKGSHEYYLEEIRRLSDVNELVGGMSADVECMTQRTSSDAPLLSPKESDMFSCRLARLKEMLYDGSGSVLETAQALVQKYPTLFPHVLPLLSCVAFEARKNLAAVFNLLVTSPTTNETFGTYLVNCYHDVMTPICDGLDAQNKSPDTALLCGTMYRSTLRHVGLYQKLLDTPTNHHEPNKDSSSGLSCHERYLYPLLDKYVFVPNFDAASDALTTVCEVLTNDKVIASEYLQRDYDNFFKRYNLMLQHDSYVTKRMSLKLLGEILLDRTNFHVMIKYISSRDNLRIIMLLLRDPSGNIQFEAFHVFKIFVANPNKPPEIVRILAQNKVKLVAYLDQFHKDKEEGDDQFRDEKALLITTLNALEEP